jgi:hypothetical protein
LAVSASALAAETGNDVSAQQHSIAVAGAEELVLSHENMTCGPNGGLGDRTDMPVSAFRRKDGSVVVLAGNQRNYFLEGPSVETAKRTSCSQMIPAIHDPDPKDFVARRWLVALHAVDYETVLGFIHNEYHGGNFFSDGCKISNHRNFECWYASATLTVSHDGGFSFHSPPAPQNVLAAPPSKFEVKKKRVGASSPKVVGNPKDGLVYVLITYRDLNRDMPAHECLLRGSGKKLDDWRAWDGHGFNMNMGSPYAVDRGADCTPVFRSYFQSVRYVPALKKFAAVGLRGRRLIYAFSDDLITWSKPQVLMQVTRKQTRQAGDPLARDYFSLLDPSSSSINFDTLESRPYLYFVQYTEDRRRRDIYRVPLTIK